MREFQPGPEDQAAVAAPPSSTEAGSRPEQVAGQSSGPSGPSGPGSAAAPQSVALLQPASADGGEAASSAQPAEPAQLAATAPALGKTQAGSILASLASHSASLAASTAASAAPTAPAAKTLGDTPQPRRFGPTVEETPSVATTRPGPAPAGPVTVGPPATASGSAGLPVANGAANMGADTGAPPLSQPGESAAAGAHDDDILPSKPRAGSRLRLPAVRVPALKTAKQPRDASVSLSASPSMRDGKTSLGEWANGLSHRLSDRLRAYNRGHGSS
jgi:hypothetical protein